jgi:hypothetical protein
MAISVRRDHLKRETIESLKQFLNEQSARLSQATPLLSSILLLGIIEIVGHALWLEGVIPGNNTGGNMLDVHMPLFWVVAIDAAAPGIVFGSAMPKCQPPS